MPSTIIIFHNIRVLAAYTYIYFCYKFAHNNRFGLISIQCKIQIKFATEMNSNDYSFLFRFFFFFFSDGELLCVRLCIDLIEKRWKNRCLNRNSKKIQFCHWYFSARTLQTTFVSIFFPMLRCFMRCLRANQIIINYFFSVHFNGRRFDVNASVNDHIDSSWLEYK